MLIVRTGKVTDVHGVSEQPGWSPRPRPHLIRQKAPIPIVPEPGGL